MNLSTTYMGLRLENPIIVSSSKLTGTLENIKKCIDHGAGAIVLKSLFEEQLLADTNKLMDQDEKYFWYPEAVDYINTYSKDFGLKEYIGMIREAKKYGDTPLIASINCISSKEWPQFAKSIQDAGADGIELNISIFPFDWSVSSKEIEDQYVEILTEVKKFISIPVSVKLGPYFTNLLQIAKRLVDAGADGLVIFNRYYRPDIDIEKEAVVKDNFLSAPEEITQPLRWASVVKSNLNCQVAASTGIQCYGGIVKVLLAGADAAQLCSVFYKNGIGYIETMLKEMKNWMEGHGYLSIADFKGKVLKDNENTAAFQRVQFMKRTVE